MHDMAIMMQCNLSKLTGIGIPTHTYGSSCFTTPQISYLLAWQDMAWVSYAQLNGTGTKYITIPYIPYLIIRRFLIIPKYDMQCPMNVFA
jgi:hypothetical protein